MHSETMRKMNVVTNQNSKHLQFNYTTVKSIIERRQQQEVLWKPSNWVEKGDPLHAWAKSHWIYMTPKWLCLSQLGDATLLLHPFRKSSVGWFSKNHSLHTGGNCRSHTVFSCLTKLIFKYKQILLKMQRLFFTKFLKTKNSSTWICKISQATWICILWLKSFLEKKKDYM